MTKQLELDKADETQESSWVDENGLNMSATGDKDISGFHQLLTSVANFFKSGTTNLARFAADAIELGMNSASSVIKLCAGTFSITKASGYALIKSDSQMLLMVPSGDTIALTTYDSLGQPSDNGVGMSGHDAVIRGNNVQTISKTIPGTRFETRLQPDVLYNGGAALTYDTAHGSGAQGTIPLSETAANFKELKVSYKTDDNAQEVYTIPSPANGVIADLGTNHPAGSGQCNDIYLKSASYSVSGASLVRTAYCNMGVHTSGNAVAAGDPITVIRVEGIR
jgi:hypothetical protein